MVCYIPLPENIEPLGTVPDTFILQYDGAARRVGHPAPWTLEKVALHGLCPGTDSLWHTLGTDDRSTALWGRSKLDLLADHRQRPTEPCMIVVDCNKVDFVLCLSVHPLFYLLECGCVPPWPIWWGCVSSPSLAQLFFLVHKCPHPHPRARTRLAERQGAVRAGEVVRSPSSQPTHHPRSDAAMRRI